MTTKGLPTIEQVSTSQLLDAAYLWVCEQRKERSHNNSIWDLRFTQGIPMGCPLSPLMAAVYLKPLDDEMKQHGFYTRYMDDWVVMVKTKHQLRKIIKLTHRILHQLKLKMHPDKTFIGCIKKGFDFLGVHFGDTPRMSNKSLENHRSKLAQRYAQGVSKARIGAYIERWTSWCAGVLNCCNNDSYLSTSMAPYECRQFGVMVDNSRSRNNDYSLPPPRIRTSATNASGSCLR